MNTVDILRAHSRWLRGGAVELVDSLVVENAIDTMCDGFERMVAALRAIRDAPGGGPGRRIACQALDGILNCQDCGQDHETVPAR